MAKYGLRGAMAIVGAADTKVGVVLNISSGAQLYAQAAKLALADAGIGKDQVDGLITCNASTERGPIRTFTRIDRGDSRYRSADVPYRRGRRSAAGTYDGACGGGYRGGSLQHGAADFRR